MNEPREDREARNPVEELAESFIERYRGGEEPEISEYTEKYPELAAEIRDLFPALLMVERLGARDHAASSPKTADEQLTSGAQKRQPLSRLGEFVILREIGRGGMGVVYEAEQESLGRRVALKVLPFHRLMDERRLARFQREARAAARLQHRGIVPVFGVGEAEDVHYYIMQFIPGQGLDQVLVELRELRKADGSLRPAPASERQRPLAGSSTMRLLREQVLELTEPTGEETAQRDESRHSPSSSDNLLAGVGHTSGRADLRYFRNVAALGVRVAEALDYAHHQGVLHRDVKPSNLLLEPNGQVWVTDFGLAKAEGGNEVTVSGEVMGTLGYMAPERLRGWSDPRSDIYSLGATLYELLTLQPAFEDSDRGRLVKKITEEDVTAPRVRESRLPRDLETACRLGECSSRVGAIQ